MKGSTFYIQVLMPYQETYTVIATFDLGHCSHVAHEVFDALLGETAPSSNRLLRISLILHDEGLRNTEVKFLNCTLDELAENTKAIITKAFRALNLD